MPPVPKAPTPPSSVVRLSAFSTVDMSFAFLSFLGSMSYNPSISVRIISRSASTRFVTRADRWSLSPNFISSTATVSFSFIMGIIL